MAQDDKPLSERSYPWTVDPTHTRSADGVEYTDRYTFREVIMAFDPDAVFPDSSTAEMVEDGVVYQYDGKPAIKIEQTAVYCEVDAEKSEAMRQAYFALSMLESKGYVSGWEKV